MAEMITKILRKNTPLKWGARYFHFPPLQKSHLIQLRIGKLQAGSVRKHVKVFLSIVCMSDSHPYAGTHAQTGEKQLSFDCPHYKSSEPSGWNHLKPHVLKAQR